jgi:hypothetical protein
MQTGG